MNFISKILAPLALAGTILPPLLFLLKALGEGPMKTIMFASTVVWFITAPFWMKGGDE